MRSEKRRVREGPPNLASLIRGLYGRVAHQLDVDPSFVSRVARGERQSKSVEATLRRELRKFLDQVSKKSFGSVRRTTARRGAAKNE